MPVWPALLAAARARPVDAALVVLLGTWVVLAGIEAPNPVVVIAAGLGLVALLALGRRWPLLPLAGVVGAFFLPAWASAGRAMEDVLLGMLVWACFLVGRWARLTRQPWAAAVVLLLLGANALEPDFGVASIVFPALFTAAPWLLGLAMQLTAQKAERAASYAETLASSRTEDIRRATDEERLRIAHELHDVVAHNMSAVSLQAQVARRRLEAGETITAADLAALEGSARLAMTDLRRLLGVLRPSTEDPDTSPSESLEDLPALVEQCQHVGQNVRVSTTGTPRTLPPALSLVAFRIIQEALSNARRHGGPGAATVHMTWLEGRLLIRVCNPVKSRARSDTTADTPADTPADTTAQTNIPEPGHGRLGMTERARLFGGTVTTQVADGLWSVEASLPTPVSEPQVLR